MKSWSPPSLHIPAWRWRKPVTTHAATTALLQPRSVIGMQQQWHDRHHRVERSSGGSILDFRRWPILCATLAQTLVLGTTKISVLYNICRSATRHPDPHAQAVW
jgi:hypothetical protein